MPKTIYPIKSDTETLPFILDGIREAGGLPRLDCSNGQAAATLLTVSGGSGAVKLPDGEHLLGENSVCYIAGNAPFSLIPAESGFTGRVVTFFGAEGVMEKLGFGKFLVAAAERTDDIVKIHDALAVTAADPLTSADTLSVQLYGLIIAACHAVFRKGEDKYGSGEVVREALKFMDRHYEQDITLERLAVISGVSLQHFCRVFRAKTGMRPMEYLARRRTAEARELLACTDMKIGEVAAAVGFDDPNYFGITFRKYEGTTPTEYRKAFGK